MSSIRKLSLVLPINNSGQLLLQHRTLDAPRKPNHWGFWGGHIEDGESPEEAAKREFMEELQMKIDDLKFFKHDIFDGKEWGKAEKFFYIVSVDKPVGYLKSLQLEGDDLRYFSYHELNKLMISEDDRQILDEIKTAGFLK